MIRPITAADASSIRKINTEQLGYEVSEAVINRQLEKLLNDPNHHFFAVCVDDQTQLLIGYIHAQVYDTLYAAPLFNVLALAVDDKIHRQGVGSQLMSALETEAKRRDIETIRVASGESRTEAHLFYEKIGFVSNKFQKHFLKKVN